MSDEASSIRIRWLRLIRWRHLASMDAIMHLQRQGEATCIAKVAWKLRQVQSRFAIIRSMTTSAVMTEKVLNHDGFRPLSMGMTAKHEYGCDGQPESDGERKVLFDVLRGSHG
jgi:hypothetical protein